MAQSAGRTKKTEPALPTESDSKLAAEASRALSQRKSANGLRVRLEDGRELVIPQAAARLLVHILTVMAEGNTVTIIPIHAELTTQEAADFLNVSRPYLIRLLEQKRIPFHKTGSHRRVRFSDLAAYKKHREAERKKILAELTKSAQELGLGY